LIKKVLKDPTLSMSEHEDPTMSPWEALRTVLTPFSWTTTCSGLFRGGDESWEAVSAYAHPIRAYLRSRYPRLTPEEGDDVAQDLLIEMRERLAPRHDPGRGRFRQLLQTAIRSRVMDHLRRRARDASREAPAATLETVEAPTEEEVQAIDLEASLVESLAAAKHELTQGGDADHDALFALADRVVHGRTEAEIAASDGVSRDAVARRLRRAREAVWRSLLRREVASDLDDASLGAVVAVAKDCMLEPARIGIHLERISTPEVRARLGDFLERFSTTRRRLPSLAAGEDGELQRAVAEVLGG